MAALLFLLVGGEVFFGFAIVTMRNITVFHLFGVKNAMRCAKFIVIFVILCYAKSEA